MTRLLALLVLLLVAACDSTTPALPLTGDYELTHVSNAALPVDASFTDTFGARNERWLVSAVLSVRTGGEWVEARTYRNQYGEWIVHSHGTWTGSVMDDSIPMERTRDGLDCQRGDGVYRYRAR